MLRYQQQYSFFDESKLGKAIRFFNLADVVLNQDLNAVYEEITKQVIAANPSIVVVDSFRTVVRKVHYHAERNHQGKSNVLLFRRVTQTRREEPVQCRERLGGLLRYYHQEAA